MTVQLEIWHLITLSVTLLGAFTAAGKALLAQMQRHLDERFTTQEAARRSHHEAMVDRLTTIENTAREDTAQWQRVERDLLNLKAELPVHYVRREDYIRGQSVIESKLDGLATKIENAQLRTVLGMAQQGGNHAS